MEAIPPHQESNGNGVYKNGVMKKIYCPQHGQKYVLKCKYPTCETPFMCSHTQCLQNHLHQQQLLAGKFDSGTLLQNFNRVQRLMSCQSLQHSTKTLKKFIDDLKASIKHVYTNLKTYNQTCQDLRSNIETPLTADFLNKISLTCDLQSSIKKELKNIKNKLNLVQPIKDRQFYLKQQLIAFLSKQITNFSWQSAIQIYSTKDELVPCQRFHQKLQDKKKLLFIFIGDDRVVGSYFTKPYPNLKQKNLQDPQSFLFISLNQQNNQSNSIIFAKFQAHQQSEFHLSATKQSYICHGNTSTLPQGIRTFQRNLQTLDYNLPSKSHSRTVNQGVFDGKLRIKYFTILQLKQNQEE